MRDITNNISPAIAVPAGVYTTDQTSPPSVDLLGFDSAALLLYIGPGGISFDLSNYVEFEMSHSDDDATYSLIEASDIDGDSLTPSTITDGIVRSLTAAHAAATIQKIGYLGGKRYLKLKVDFTGTHGSGTPITALVIRGNPGNAPV